MINSMPNGLRNWIVLNDWLYTNGELKDEYMFKIKSRIAV